MQMLEDGSQSEDTDTESLKATWRHTLHFYITFQGKVLWRPESPLQPCDKWLFPLPSDTWGERKKHISRQVVSLLAISSVRSITFPCILKSSCYWIPSGCYSDGLLKTPNVHSTCQSSNDYKSQYSLSCSVVLSSQPFLYALLVKFF
jgi:hypothetical protein